MVKVIKFGAVFVGKLYAPAGFHPFIGSTGNTGANPQIINRITLKFLPDTVFESVTRSQKDNKHKDAPGHTESGQKGPELILSDSAEYFLPFIQVEHYR
jgi:hypothetical protein